MKSLILFASVAICAVVGQSPPTPSSPAPAPVPTNPAPTAPAPAPVPTSPAPTAPVPAAPGSPAPVAPVPANPAPAPVPVAPAPTAPAPTAPAPTAPAPTAPVPTAPTVPAPTAPAPTAPVVPAPTAPAPVAPAPQAPGTTAPVPVPVPVPEKEVLPYRVIVARFNDTLSGESLGTKVIEPLTAAQKALVSVVKLNDTSLSFTVDPGTDAAEALRLIKAELAKNIVQGSKTYAVAHLVEVDPADIELPSIAINVTAKFNQTVSATNFLLLHSQVISKLSAAQKAAVMPELSGDTIKFVIWDLEGVDEDEVLAAIQAALAAPITVGGTTYGATYTVEDARKSDGGSSSGSIILIIVIIIIIIIIAVVVAGLLYYFLIHSKKGSKKTGPETAGHYDNSNNA